MKTAQQIIERRRELWEQHRDIEQDREYTQAVAGYMVSEEGKGIREEISKNAYLLIEMVMVVVDKEGQTVPFFFNEVQQDFINDLYKSKEEYRQGKRNHLNFLLLKGRQQGFTTVITADQLACSIVTRNFIGYTMANEDDNSTSIFEDKAKFPLENIPEALKPTEKFNNRRELHFEKLNSKWRVATAGKDKARSKTIRYFHGSEAAFWKDGIQRIMAGLGNALTKDSIKILETTANGYNEYKDLWDGASDGSNNWTPLFYAWWRTPEYRLNFESDHKEKDFKQRLNTSTDWIYQRCKWLIDVIKLDWNQVYWYYHKWRDQGELIKQEFPCSPDEAFLASGRCVFDKDIVIQHKEYLKKLYQEKPPLRGKFLFEWNNPDTKDKIKDNTIKFEPNTEGYIWIYETPQPGYPYVLGGDTKGEGSDFFTGTAINNVTGKRAAVLHANLDPDEYTHQMYCLGKYYNYALIGIEINFDIYPVKELERLKYHRQYKRQVIDKISNERQDKHGWKTDGNTRPMIISNEVVLVRDNIDLFTHTTMLDECLTFVYDANGRPDAESGKHDDLLFSDMIANQIRTQFRMKVEEGESGGLQGYYTESELQDMGYTKLQIKKIMQGMKSY